MGVIKVETFDVNVTATNTQTHTLTNDVGSLNSAFVRRTTSIDKQSGLTTSTSNANPNSASGAAFLGGTSTVSFRQNTTGSQKIVGEVWRYTGAASGADEFIVRGRFAITMTGNTASQAVSGISNRDKCIPFWTGTDCSNTSVSDYDASTVSVYIDSSDNIQLQRGSSTGTLVVYITVVEFTGSNWGVGHVRSASHDTSDELNITIKEGSDAVSGSDFDVGSWDSATIIEASLEGDTSETGLSDNLAVWKNGTSTTQASFLIHQDTNARNDGVSYAHILAHSNLAVNRAENTSFSEGNGSYTSAPWPAGASTNQSLDELSLEWFSDTTGTGTAHARGRLSAYITAASGSITTWVHRSGNNVRVNYGVVDLTNINGSIAISISSVDGDNEILNSQDNIVIAGGPFEAVQGTGKVELVENSDYTGTKVEVSNYDSWSDTSIQVDISSVGALADTNCFLFVTTDSGSQGFAAVKVGVPPITYTEAVQALSPDHYWTLDNNYTDIEAGLNWTVAGGSPIFTTVPLTRGRVNSWRVSANGQEAGPANSTNMNDGALSTRSMGGWIRITQVQDSFVMFYEEGGGINNIAFFMGIGGILIAQLADTGDDNVHAYSDFPLEPNRNYHIMFRFDYTQAVADDRRFELFIDGVLQSSTFGNPLTSSGGHLDSHTGDIEWGDSGDSLEVFGTDINFPAAITTYFQDWATWTEYLTESTIRTELFEQGVRGDITISAGTESAMQTALDAYADTVQPNSDCTFVIAACTDGDFTLEFDNIVFNDGTSIQVQYLGLNTLTAKNLNGSNLESSKISELNGGTVAILTPSTLTVAGLQAGSEVRVFEEGTTTEISGIESTSGSWQTSVEVSAVDISVLNLDHQMVKIKNVNTSSNAFVPVVQQTDRQYENP